MITDYFSYLYSLERTVLKYDLTNIKLLLRELGNPQNGLNFIHIAGTNGKGAVASAAASILQENGLKTGLFTSPHILRFNERIRINGKCISDKWIKEFLDRNYVFLKNMSPSFFEVNTAMAFKYFAEKKVEAAVIETGMGGRLDSTNIIEPVVSIITQLAIDHTQYLGRTLLEIAVEKAGIIKPGTDVVVSDSHPGLIRIFKRRADPDRVHFIDGITKVSILDSSLKGIRFKSTVKFKGKEFHNTFSSSLPGKFQARNILAGLLASIIFFGRTGKKFSQKKASLGIKKIVENTGYRCRFETFMHKKHRIIFDVSHNPDGIKKSMQILEGKKADAIIFAMMRDKDYKSAVAELLKHPVTVIFTKLEYQRSQDPAVMMEYAEKIKKYKGQLFYSATNVNKAIKLAFESAGRKGTILITGSFFLVSEAITGLKLKKHFS